MSSLPEKEPRLAAVQRGNDPALNTSVAAKGSGHGVSDRPKEIGGRKGPDPTRYGDWEKNGRCIDF